MSYSTKQLLAILDAAIKGVTTTTTLGATILNPQQFDRYVRVLQYKTAILGRYRFQPMDSQIVDIDRIAFGERIMGVPAAEGEAKDEDKDTTEQGEGEQHLLPKDILRRLLEGESLKGPPAYQDLIDAYFRGLSQRSTEEPAE